MKSFASDNYSSVSKEVMDALIACNHDHVPSYGNDPYTLNAIQLLKQNFGDDITVYFALSGTGANTIGLKAMTKSHHAILCAESAHIVGHEVGAVYKSIGASITTMQEHLGKITPELIENAFQKTSYWGRHGNKPAVVSISQSTEFGTVYTIDELKNISVICKKLKLLFHMDGCRLANAAASLNTTLKSLTKDVGVDVLSFGGTKNGLMFGEAVIFFQTELANEFEYIQKQELQLISKMRYLSAQFIAYLENKLWYRNANHANQMCARLAEGLLQIKSIQLFVPVATNLLFAFFPETIIQNMQAKFPFYMWDEKRNIVRLVTSFDITTEDVDGFVEMASR